MSETDTNNRLFLLDAYALIFRAYFAFARNPRVTSKGMDTSAIFGFTTTLMELLQKENPSHIAVVFDTAAPTQRHEEFEAYKANRDETPEAIKIAVPYIHRICEAFRIPTLGVDGYEADDVIGTLAKQAEKRGYRVFMMTPDKDFGQLVSDNIFMYRPGRGGEPAQVWGIPEILEKFQIERVEQVIDMLGMMGDAVDNIPGLTGVGEKTAQKLLAQYGSLEATLEHADEIKGKLGEKIRESAEMGLLSKKLATIMTDAPIEFDETQFQRDPIDEDLLREVFSELEFRTLLTRALGEKTESTAQPFMVPAQPNNGQGDLFSAPAEPTAAAPVTGGFRNLSNTDHLYQTLEYPEEVKMLLDLLMKQKTVCFDTETTSLENLDAELVGIAFSWQPGKAYFLRFPTNQKEATAWMNTLRPFFESQQIVKIGQNLKYDIGVLANYGVTVAEPLFDTMLAHYLIQPDMRHNMDVLSETYLGYQPLSIEELIGKKGKAQKSMSEVDSRLLTEYAGEDADITLQLAMHFEPKLKETGVQKVFETIEVPLVPVLSDMEREGIRLDVPALEKMSKEFTDDLIRLEKEVTELAGVSFNLGSPKQLGEVLFDHLKIGGKPKKTKTGQYATSEDVLQSLAKEHPIIEHILDYRQIQKLKGTYVDALPGLVHPRTGRIHTSFNQAVAATGRLSSNNPNLQNIPIRTERGREIRKAFIPRDENHILLSADYSQIELRLIAELSGDETMKQAFRNGQDIHAATAARVFGVPLEEVTREQRSHAKTVNFGIIYGVSAFGLSQQTSLSRSEAADIIQSYFRTYPGIKDYMDRQVQFARENGYVETLSGRRRYLNEINSRNQVVRGHAERNAVNAPIQGSAADIIKLAMIRLHREMTAKNLRSKMVLQVHDELVFDADKSEVDQLKPMIINCMQHAVETEVPLEVEVGEGQNWLEAH